ncbi:MAG: penicillin-binding protein 2 [Kiritimatiellia bacterium]
MILIATLVGLLFLGVLGQLVRLHILRRGYVPPTYYVVKRDLLALRGRILDRNGKPLAESLPGRMVFIDPQDPKLEGPRVDRSTLPLDVAKVLGVREEDVIKAFRETKNRSVRLCVTADESIIHEVLARQAASTNRFAGIGMEEREIRSRPNGARLCHVLGYVNADGVGTYGIEQKYDRQLQGEKGRIITAVDAARREIRSRRAEDIPEIQGNDIWLTIDNNVQYIIENALSKALETYNADSGIILVQHVKTGELLGMATLPSFDPQHYSSVDTNLWKNIAISRNFEPGSVMKVITVAAALQHGVITERSTFDVGRAGIWYYAGRPLRDHAYGVITPREILAKSSNIGTAMIGLRLATPAPQKGFRHEYERLWYCFKSMGFGERVGLELPGEEGGILPHWSRWSKLSPTRMTIGQGVAVTAVQLCNAYATIANKGVRMRPTVIKEIRSAEGALIERNEPEVLGRPLSARVCHSMLTMMQAVTDRSQGGTARRAALKDYTVAGKTGTGQIPSNGVYNNQDYNASFVGIYPATAPELVILVNVEKPRGIYHQGGNVAAPVFASVAEDIGHYLGIPADKHPEVKE